MYIYRTGLIGKAVHSRIESARSGETVSESFGETLKSMMEQTNTGVKTVGTASAKTAERTASAHRINGSSLMYAMQNTETDTTASAVLNKLGLNGSSSDNAVKTSADSLSSEIKKLNGLLESDGAENEALIKTELSSFTEKYNSLLTVLGSADTSSGIMYSNILKIAAGNAKNSLADAGISIRGDNRLEFSAENFRSADISAFLAGISPSVSSVSDFASTVSSSAAADIFGTDDSSGSLLSSYYSTLTGLLM